MAEVIHIHVVADSTGDTAARVARAARAQYADREIRIIRHPRVGSPEALRAVVDPLTGLTRTVVVFSTLADEELKALLAQLCAEAGLVHVDLLEPAVDALQRAIGEAPSRTVHPIGVGEDYFRRIQAMEFAIANDDGKLTSPLSAADIVLVGASRTGKTPLSMYLGYLGYKTTNIPLVPGIPAPRALFEVDRWKIVGLTIDPERLQEIRHRRVRHLGATAGRDGYAELAKIYDELEEVGAVQRRLGCPVLDTTALAMEEAAVRVIELVEHRRDQLA
ncbi:MAG TPA: pyruvate, water dikinase regulatory protein [Actinotalea caeni]|uniref:pyruvate, water dikinase regulatory protein n=1 Tax=Actinotalea caeni TaxID=1348467 RepID=UPI0012E1AE47|nr:pyruvate, water dikinase regulatory protein [Actinotalea caeni]HLV56011.1 pyruvate, water dikinase regulatory protein [Actinotalea caeni]